MVNFGYGMLGLERRAQKWKMDENYFVETRFKRKYAATKIDQ